VACAAEDDVERGLLLRGGTVAARGRGRARSRDRHRRGGGDAPLVLDLLLQLDELEDAHLPQIVEQLVDGVRHYSSSLGCSVAASSVAGSSPTTASATRSSVCDST